MAPHAFPEGGRWPRAHRAVLAVEKDGRLALVWCAGDVAIEGQEAIAQVSCAHRPPRCIVGLRMLRREDAAQVRVGIPDATKIANAVGDESEQDLSGGDIGTLDRELEHGTIGAQQDVLAAAGIDEDVFYAVQPWDE